MSLVDEIRLSHAKTHFSAVMDDVVHHFDVAECLIERACRELLRLHSVADVTVEVTVERRDVGVVAHGEVVRDEETHRSVWVALRQSL